MWVFFLGYKESSLKKKEGLIPCIVYFGLGRGFFFGFDTGVHTLDLLPLHFSSASSERFGRNFKNTPLSMEGWWLHCNITRRIWEEKWQRAFGTR